MNTYRIYFYIFIILLTMLVFAPTQSFLSHLIAMHIFTYIQSVYIVIVHVSVFACTHVFICASVCVCLCMYMLMYVRIHVL